ncbi:MAG: YtxH domain-containing protein [Rhodothermaceae bacterium]|nr:YtxH domain-containing protein [Rhodothermaceae bacterium]MXX58806.1 YtxH domain-containing protein [Rhodothermaceae bacterium]MYD18844.1 YtxH domain-containing protein [Rhodothermaceae bacterium]MYD57351.1 YtxH domain-containing protein [Rhodothermaceae bacterium]MYI42401.1 YtxH domain-containing protein [Rhodothermaceae bacterium]
MSKDHGLGNVPRALGWGLLLGGGIGFTLGLLLAPEEGSQLRRRVTYHLEGLANQIGTLAETMKTPGKDADARQKGEALVAKAEEQAREINSRMDEILGSASASRPES